MTVPIVEFMARAMYDGQHPSVPWESAPELHRSMWRTWARSELQYAVAMVIIRQVFPQAEVIGG